MTIEAYRNHSALNFSRMKWLLKSPRHFMVEGPREKEETLAMRLGRAVDEWILTGEVRPFAIMPEEIEKATGKGSRTAKQAWLAEQEQQGLTAYKQEEYDTQMAMQKALESSPEFQKLLEVCPQRQLPVFAKYRGVEVKALLDLAGHDMSGHRCFGDLKTSVSAAPRDFAKKAANLDYDLQQALYAAALASSEGLEDEPAMFWAVVESSASAPVSIFAVPREAMDSGQRKLNKCIDLYLQCTESGEWPGYGQGIQQLKWPSWASNNEN